jgi:hypothetical protein
LSFDVHPRCNFSATGCATCDHDVICDSQLHPKQRFDGWRRSSARLMEMAATVDSATGSTSVEADINKSWKPGRHRSGQVTLGCRYRRRTDGNLPRIFALESGLALMPCQRRHSAGVKLWRSCFAKCRLIGVVVVAGPLSPTSWLERKGTGPSPNSPRAPTPAAPCRVSARRSRLACATARRAGAGSRSHAI